MLKNIIGPAAFYNHLKMMEEHKPADYPPGCSDRYLQIIRHPATEIRSSPNTCSEMILSVMHNDWLTYSQVRQRLIERGIKQSRFGGLSAMLNKMHRRGQLERRGTSQKYEYHVPRGAYAA